MRIPYSTVNGRFYLANVDCDYAFSSWKTYEEACACYLRMKEHQPEDADKVFVILEIGPGVSVGRRPLPEPAGQTDALAL